MNKQDRNACAQKVVRQMALYVRADLSETVRPYLTGLDDPDESEWEVYEVVLAILRSAQIPPEKL